MKPFGTLIIFCALLTALFIPGADAQTAQKSEDATVEKIETVRTRKTNPAEMPRVTSNRDRVSATGYWDGDSNEETQERPNPLDAKAAQVLDPVRDPVRRPQQALAR